MRKRVIQLVAPVLLGVAAVAFAAVSTDYDKKADFSRYHTYSWIEARAGNSLWADRIRSNVDSQLAAKGWTKVAQGGDAAIAAFGKTTERDTLQTFYTGFPGWGWRRWGNGTAITTVVPERVGNLNVDIFDGTSKKLIWRGVGSKTLSDKPDKNVEKLEDVVADMFKKFPPPERT